MSTAALATYLNDHLAGSVGAIELLEQGLESSEGTPLESFFTEVLGAVREDQELLRDLIRGIDASESPLKKAGAWLAEKVSRVKLGGGWAERSPLSRLEMLETLGMGIQGKLALWRALRTVADSHPALRALDFSDLERRAMKQHDQVEAQRLAAAREALVA
ncbi:MAG: hypothetical protein ACREMX_11405 [Gemmatimonadales bacterium]